MRGCLPLTVAIATVALAAPASAGFPNEVTVGDDFFAPTPLSLSVGGEVHWQNGITLNQHTVTQDKGLFKSGEASTTIDFSRIPSAGTFPYYCTIHGGKGGVGMSGVVRVAPSLGFPKSARGASQVFPIRWAHKATDTGDQFDVQYKVDDGKWKDWKKNTSKSSALFGKNGKPVTAKAGKTYKVRARSEKASNPRKRSDWSPALKFFVI